MRVCVCMHGLRLTVVHGGIPCTLRGDNRWSTNAGVRKWASDSGNVVAVVLCIVKYALHYILYLCNPLVKMSNEMCLHACAAFWQTTYIPALGLY